MSKRPDDAAKVAGLASILQSGNRPKDVPPSPAPAPAVTETSPVSVPATPSPERRPQKASVGKYRDPNYHQFAVYLRKATQKKVKRKLEDMETGQDLSELVQELLEQWLASR